MKRPDPLPQDDPEEWMDHALSVLLSIVAEAGEDVPESVRLSRRLTPYAAAARYPGIAERVTEEDHAEAVRLAESVVNWVKGRLVTSNKEIEHV